MPSTRRQKVKTRKSREMDMMSDFENMDVILGNENKSLIERELPEVIGNSENHCDIESGSQLRRNLSRENNFGQYVHEGTIPMQDWFQETMKTFTSEFNMMSMMHTQINRAITSAIAERVLSELQIIVSSMSSSGNRDTESGLSPDSPNVRENSIGFNSKIIKGLSICSWLI